MTLPEPSLHDLGESNWQAIVEAGERTCRAYSSRFFGAAREVGEGTEGPAAALLLLAAVTSFHLELEKHNDPFQPMLRVQEGRSPVPGDLTPAHLAVLEEFLPQVPDDELKARLADVLWLQVRPRKHLLALEAAAAYLRSSRTLMTEHPVDAIERLERAFQLAASLGRTNEPFREVTACCHDILGGLQTADHSYVARRVLELLAKFRGGDALKLSESAAARAQAAEEQHHWLVARQLWVLKLQWDREREDAEGEVQSLQAIADSFAQEARQLIEGESTSALFIVEILQQGVEAYRRVPGAAEQERELHLKLLEVQRRARAELRGSALDTTELDGHVQTIVEQSKAMVRGKSLRNALLALPFVARHPSYERGRAAVAERIANHPILFMFTTTHLDANGRVATRRPTIFSGDPQEQEALILAELYHDMRIDRLLSVSAAIEPARRQILEEHSPRLEDVAELLQHSPFVPENRLYLYSRGVYAGLTGDWVSSMHILIPQLENSIRYVLHRQGTVTSSLTAEGTQEAFNLNRLLYLPEAQELFGVDTVFDMRGLLVEKTGANARNELVHGLNPDGYFFTPEPVYAWWVAIRLALFHVALDAAEAEGGPAEAGADGEDAATA